METIIIKGKTAATITLNQSKAYLRGQTEAVLNIENNEQRREIENLEEKGFITVLRGDVSVPIVSQPKVEDKQKIKHIEESEGSPTLTIPKKRGRPKNQIAKTEHQRVLEAEAENQKMGSKVTVNLRGDMVETTMVPNYTGNNEESEITQDSIDAMKKIEEEEIQSKKEEKKHRKVRKKNRKKDNNTAIIHTGKGYKKVETPNSILPGQEEVRNADPFIDTKFDDGNKDDKLGDAFIEV
jgi:hypothetical protein